MKFASTGNTQEEENSDENDLNELFANKLVPIQQSLYQKDKSIDVIIENLENDY